MNDGTAGLAELLRSPTFWIGTVVVGLLLNVVGHFIATRLEKTTSGAFEAYRKRASRRAKEIDALARRLIEHEGLVTIWASERQFLATVGVAGFTSAMVLFAGGSLLIALGQTDRATPFLVFGFLVLASGFVGWVAVPSRARVLQAYVALLEEGASPLTSARPDREGRAIREYRKARSSATWHFCVNCSTWPTADFEVRMTSPADGEICNECRAKERGGTCKTR